MWKEAVVVYLGHYLRMSGRAEVNHDVIQNSLLPGWDSKLKSTTYNLEASPFKPPCSLGRPQHVEDKLQSGLFVSWKLWTLGTSVFFSLPNCVKIILKGRFATRLASVLFTVQHGTCSSSESRLKLVLRPYVFSDTSFNFPLLWINRFFVI